MSAAARHQARRAIGKRFRALLADPSRKPRHDAVDVIAARAVERYRRDIRPIWAGLGRAVETVIREGRL